MWSSAWTDEITRASSTCLGGKKARELGQSKEDWGKHDSQASLAFIIKDIL